MPWRRTNRRRPRERSAPSFPSEPLFEKALGEDVVERLDHGTPDLLRDPLAIEHAPVDRIDAAVANLGMVVGDIDDDDAARHVRKQSSRKIGDRLRWDRKDDDFSGLAGVDNGNGSQSVICSSRNAAFGGDQHLSQVLPAHASVVGGGVRLELLSAGETADDDGIETGVAYECGDKL